MKKSLFMAVVAAAMLMSGCSQKEPEVDMTQQTAGQEAKSADTGLDTIQGSTESSNIMSEDARMAKIREIEASAKKIYFDFDKFNIRPDQEPRVDEDARLFTSEDAKDLTIKIEGNCDEWGTDEYNYALGLKRAKSVRDALSVKGIDESRMVMVSYGESNPVCTEHTKECWAKNRRVEFKLLP
ncbi:OmpA family protein [Hydrogenimonas urashimensis]|uniref:OmpA family protein n=1 Tax=Hydrogenimonas urashimensis TaxID=2740515 RepID=UPI00191511BC|nr:OmpA family protein [Hydrogenimonas urashimensis]